MSFDAEHNIVLPGGCASTGGQTLCKLVLRMEKASVKLSLLRRELETGCCPGGVHGQNKVSQLCPPSPQQSLCIAATPDLVLNVASGNNKADKWFRRSGSGHQTVCTQEESPTLFCFTRRTGLNKQETPPNAYINGTVNYGFALQVSNTVM